AVGSIVWALRGLAPRDPPAWLRHVPLLGALLAWALRGRGGREPVALLRGQTGESALTPGRPRWGWGGAGVALLLSPAVRGRWRRTTRPRPGRSSAAGRCC